MDCQGFLAAGWVAMFCFPLICQQRAPECLPALACASSSHRTEAFFIQGGYGQVLGSKHGSPFLQIAVGMRW